MSAVIPKSSSVSVSAAWAAIILTVVGGSGFLVLPVILGSAVVDLQLTDNQVGLLGSSVLTGAAISALIASFLVRSLNWRILACAALGLESVSFLVATQVSGFPLVMFPLVLASSGGGIAVSLGLTILSDHKKPERMFGFALTAQVAFQVIGLSTLPWFVESGRFDLCLGILAGLSVLGLLMVRRIPTQGAERSHGYEMTIRDMLYQPWALLSLAGCMFFFVNIGSVWAYVERMGSESAISPGVLGSVLAGSVAAGMLGSLAASWQGKRFGYALPLVLASAGMLLAIYLLRVPMSSGTMAFAFGLYNFVWNYSLTYQYVVVATVDSTGRFVAAAPAFHALGGAIGPALAAMFVTDASLLPVNVIAAVATVCSLASFSITLRKSGG